MGQLRLSTTVLALLLAAFSIFALSRAKHFFCVNNTQQTLSLRLSRSLKPKVNLCPYLRDEAGSAQWRTCHWELKILEMEHPAQLALELFFTVRYQRNDFHVTQAKAKSFLDTMKLLAAVNQDKCLGALSGGWNPELHFQLFPIRDNSDSVSIVFELNTLGKTNISDLFYPRVSYSNRHSCSGDLVHYRGRCYGARYTDKLSQAAGFHSEADVRGFLAAYRKDVAMPGSSVPPLTSPARLAMTRCNNNDSHHLIMAWNRDNKNDCIRVPVPANRTQPGSGDCVSVREDPASGEPVFQPVLCHGPMLTLLSFQSVPPSLGDCSSEEVGLPPSGECCRGSADAKPVEAAQAACSRLCQYLVGIFVAGACIVAVAFAYRHRSRIRGILHSTCQPRSRASSCHEPEGQKFNSRDDNSH